MKRRAQVLAERWHGETNHKYDGHPYTFHLGMVVAAAREFIHLVPQSAQKVIYDSCWLHDVIEDCRVTYNDVKTEMGLEVAEIVYALTNEKGRTRKDRANEKYYEGIRNVEFASFVKCCDRLANIQHSVNTNSSMLNAYRKEHQAFKQFLGDDTTLTPIFEKMGQLLLTEKRKEQLSKIL